MKNKKIDFLQVFTVLGLCIIAAGVFKYGFIVGMNFWLSLVFFLVFLLGSLVAHVIIHELGHLVFGLLTGYEFLAFRIFSLALVKTKDGLRPKSFYIYGTLGQCILGPPPAENPDDFPYRAYNYGGGVFNILAGLLSLVVFFGGPNFYLSLGFGIIGLILALSNLLIIPGVPNDGSNVKDLDQSDLARKSFYYLLASVKDSINSKDPQLSGLDYYNMNKEDLTLNTSINMAINDMTVLVYEDRLRETIDLGKYLLNTLGQNEIFTNLLKENLLYPYLLYQDNKAIEDLFKDKAFKDYINSVSAINTYLARFMVASLYDKDPEKAKTWADKYERSKKSYPFLTDIIIFDELVKKTQGVLAYNERTHWLDQASSTNDLALDLGQSSSNKDTVIAKSQTQGRGQRDKAFASPEGGLYMSVFLRPTYGIDQLRYVTARTGLAVREALYEAFGLETQVKWINDIVYQDKKLGGILTEGQIQWKSLESMVIGLGLNLGDSPPLVEAIGLGYDYHWATGRVLYHLRPKLEDIGLRQVSEDFIESYNQALYKKDQLVDYELEGQAYQGVLQGVDDNMNLLLDGQPYGLGQIKLDLYE